MSQAESLTQRRPRAILRRSSGLWEHATNLGVWGLSLDVVPATGSLSCTAAGRITNCGRPAAGLRVVCWLVTQIGLPDLGKPCRVSWPTSRQVGEKTSTGDGTFAIAFSVFRPADACYFSAKVRVELFDGATRVWQSPQVALAPTVRFDHELVPDCPGDGAVIRVIDDRGATVSKADVYVNGRLRGRTDASGNLVLPNGLAMGDRLVARKVWRQTATPRDWIYRVYVTSLRVRHDQDGNNVQLSQQLVTDPELVQVVRVERRNTLVGLNLRASIEWDATTLDFRRYQARLYDLSELLYNATDGQMLVEQVSLADDGLWWDEADLQIYANLNQASNASVDGLFNDRGHIRLNPNDAHFVGTLLHELGHYAFGVLDEYEDAAGENDTSNGPPCTLNSDDTQPPYADGFGKDSCFMRGAREGAGGKNQKKLCSMHPDNPHAPGTEQGPVDCWTELVDRFGDSAKWRLQTPVSRNAIVDRLPDSGLMLRGSEPPPGDDQRPLSFVPVLDWKTTAREVPANHPNLCDQLVLRARYHSSVVEGAHVVLLTAEGRRIYQGRTKVTKPYRLNYGVQTGPGEVPIRGAHLGDHLDAYLPLGGLSFAFDRVQVGVCGGTVVANLERVEVDPRELDDWLHKFVRDPVVRPLWPGERKAIASADGRVRLVMQDGSIETAGELKLAERPDLMPALPASHSVVSGPYLATCTTGARLRRPAVLRFDLLGEAAERQTFEVWAGDEEGHWAELEGATTNQRVVTANVDRLGVWILLLHRGE